MACLYLSPFWAIANRPPIVVTDPMPVSQRKRLPRRFRFGRGR